ncbi:signal-regulatory protein beta-2-like [Ictalurus furcatus]|uniref:signal-regulatory protein beta-2-like n=1 Tax=Ictalurus furcatus TaxID=66913 RepID=UPI0023509B2D|nr:signal-regulatory protein beta-2-like [Ictalurus furcatus]
MVVISISLKFHPLFLDALYLILNSFLTPAQAVDISGPSFIPMKAGENITLNCPFVAGQGVLNIVIWYKQIFGEMPKKVGERSSYTDVKISPEFKTSGFKMEATDHSFSLKISHVKKEHQGLYYCVEFSWDNVSLSRGMLLAVTDDRDVKVSVVQSGVSDSVPAGASVTLQCSVLSESRSAVLQVLWFRAAPPQSHPQIIYTHHNSSHQCESGSSTHTCVYNFSKNILSLNDTGTYYCAVAVCGKIIFGNGTRVELENVPEIG